ncbi:MAG: ribose-5-phosphate isomerase RpiA [Caldimonas sp.]
MTQDELKRQVAEAALVYVPAGAVIGIGSGTTVNHFIDVLGALPVGIAGAVSSSAASTARLVGRGIRVLEAGDVTSLPVCFDGADEIDGEGAMIKGGGAALTREKIVADLAERFICIADESKLVTRLGRFPLPVEVIPMASAQVARRFAAMGGRAVPRQGVVTDNGGAILDVHDLVIEDSAALEREINQWAGVVCVGLFARHRASVCLLGTPAGVRTLTF